MTPHLAGRVAVVTGATGGLGRSISLALGRAGADLIVHYHRRRESAEALAAELAAIGRRAIVAQAELSRPEEAERLIQTAEAAFGRIDILVNSAGITRDCLILDMAPGEWDEVLRINLSGTFHMLRAAAAPMMVQRSGAIINISSVTSSYGWPGQSNYAASKAGLDALTRCAATELARFNVRVNSVAPGMLRSEMSEQAMKTVGDRLLQMIPVRRFGVPDDIAPVVLFLASDQASYITGEIISVNGGLGMGLPAIGGRRAEGHHKGEKPL